MRSRLVVGVAVVAAIAAFYGLRRGRTSRPASAGSSASTATPSGSPARAPRPPAHVTRLSPEQRAEVADRIARARASRAATQAPAAPSLPAPTTPRPALPAATPPPEELKVSIRDAMREAIPILTECFDQHGHDITALDVKAHLTLTGDPDIGTLIDAHQLYDGEGQPLAQAFDDCLRATFQQLQLPPLTEGDQVEVTYPLRFERSGE